MFPKALIKNTEENHPEYNRLVLAQQKIKVINDELNDSKRKAELRDEVYKLHIHLAEKPPDFVRFSILISLLLLT
jgi:hypothetical protein